MLEMQPRCAFIAQADVARMRRIGYARSQASPMQSSPWQALSDLIIVPGHAVLRQGSSAPATSDDAWVLQPFQRGEAPCYVDHIRQGVLRAQASPSSLLVFSGGQTRIEAGPVSEADSCMRVAAAFAWWSCGSVQARATTETFARDSFENLLFGICRFRQCCGKLPRRVTVVGWAFKQRRFDLHRSTLGFPADRFEYLGANDPNDLDAAMRGETANALEPFLADPMGARAPLADKRRMRNPFHRRHDYVASCPELRELLLSPSPLPAERLPW